VNSRVAIVKTDRGAKPFQRALSLIGGIDDLNVKDRDVTIKSGVFDRRALNYPTVEVTENVVAALDRARHIYLAESDNYCGPALKRLQIWRKVFTERVLPFNLSKDENVKQAKIIGEELNLSHILYEPHVRVSFHAFRGWRGTGQTLYGSILKNLLGIIPDVRKDRFHEKLSIALVDILEAIGGLNLAVLDATYTYYGKFKEGRPMNRIRTNLMVVGRDAIAVDAVGFALVGENPLDIASMVEATKRGLGQADLKKIEIVGEPIEKAKIELPS
jgi:uncharacterized protein (DUF362 family)